MVTTGGHRCRHAGMAEGARGYLYLCCPKTFWPTTNSTFIGGLSFRTHCAPGSVPIMMSFSKEEFNHRKCRSTASSLSMPLLPISVHKGIAIASHFARGLCTPQPQCWWKEGFPCPNGRLRNIMVCQAWHERPRCHLWNCTLEMYNIENASCDRLHPSC